MKKTLILVLLFLSLVPAFVFADFDLSSAVYDQIREPFVPLSPRSKAMGGVSVVSVGKDDVFYLNPASLANKDLAISLPYFTIGLYHPASLLSSGFISNLSGFDMSKMMDAVIPLLGAGQGKIFDIGAGVQFAMSGFGFSIDFKDSLLTYAPLDSTGGVSSSIVDQLNVAITFGYGHRFGFGKTLSLDVGGSISFNYLAFNQAITGQDLLDIAAGKKSFFGYFQSLPIMAGFSIPFTLGATVNLPLGFSVGTVVKNINGLYYLKTSNGYSGLPFGSGKTDTFFSDVSWDIGVAWTYDKFGKLFTPTIEFDFVDIASLFYKANDGEGGRAFLERLKLGVEIETLYVLDIWAGLNGGYWSFGLGLDFYALRIDMAYYWEEYGLVAGEKSLDTFLVKINIGW